MKYQLTGFALLEGFGRGESEWSAIEVREKQFAFLNSGGEETMRIPRAIRVPNIKGDATFTGFAQMNVTWAEAGRIPLGDESISLFTREGGTQALEGAARFLHENRLTS
jgi:hypothetical protein